MIARLILSALSVGAAARLLDGVSIDHWAWTVVIAIGMALLNSLVRPVIKLVALPINLLTLGLFTFVINGCMVLLCAWLVNAFHVDGLADAILFSVVVSIINWLLNWIFDK